MSENGHCACETAREHRRSCCSDALSRDYSLLFPNFHGGHRLKQAPQASFSLQRVIVSE